jgi:cytochrome c
MTTHDLISARGLCAAVLALSGLTGLTQASAQDLGKGAALFATHCSECHSVKEGKDKKGPSLFASFGAKSAFREGFAYSDALRGAGLTWTADNLNAYITNPKQKVPGGKMKYDGLDNAAERADLIAYLASVTKR